MAIFSRHLFSSLGCPWCPFCQTRLRKCFSFTADYTGSEVVTRYYYNYPLLLFAFTFYILFNPRCTIWLAMFVKDILPCVVTIASEADVAHCSDVRLCKTFCWSMITLVSFHSHVHVATFACVAVDNPCWQLAWSSYPVCVILISIWRHLHIQLSSCSYIPLTSFS